MSFTVYILKCATGTYYTGQTNNIERRVKEHQSGHCWSTHDKRPVKLIYTTQVKTRSQARKLEVHIKGRGARRYLQNVELQKQFGHLCTVSL